MGIDWYTCVICGECMPDCSPMFWCTCGEHLCERCGDRQVEKYGFNEDDGCLNECDECTESIVHDRDVLEYLLSKAKMTKEQVVTAIENERKEGGC